MVQPIRVNDRVKILLDSRFWDRAGWFEGTVVRIDPYSDHRNFYWVELDDEIQSSRGGRTRLAAVINPRHIVKA